MNIKKPPDFLEGNFLYLEYLATSQANALSTGNGLQGNVLMHESAQVGKGCMIGPDVTIGKGCVIEDGVRLARCILLEGCTIRSHAVVLDSIVGWRATVRPFPPPFDLFPRFSNSWFTFTGW